MKARKNAGDDWKNRLFGPLEAVSRQADLSLHGMRELRLDDHRGLLAYSEEKIVVQMPDRALSITGRKLTLRSMTAHTLHIHGEIRSVETVE